MSYTLSIGRSSPMCLLFLLDQSKEMESLICGTSIRKCDALTDIVNSFLNNQIIRCGFGGGVRDWFEVAALGYRTDGNDNPIVQTAFQNELAKFGDAFIKISQFQEHPLRIVQRTQACFDPDTGEQENVKVLVPEWLEPVASGRAAMSWALNRASSMLQQWIHDHRHCVPPMVIHITGGDSADAESSENAKSLTEQSTDDGNVLLFNCYLSANVTEGSLFPKNLESQFDSAALALISIISPISF